MEPVPWNRFHGEDGMAGTPSATSPSHAGVSKATASRVLNGSIQRRPATRAIASSTAMAELDYTPSSAARRLSFGRTLTISVVTSFLTRPQAAERLRGVDAVLSDSEFDLVIYNVETDRQTGPVPARARARAADRRPARHLAAAARRGRAAPVVGGDPGRRRSMRTRLRSRDCPTSSGDDIGGGEAATRHLLELGHRRIAFVGDEFDNPFGFTSSRHRYIGYERALAAAGVSPSSRSSWRSAPTAATRPASWPPASSRWTTGRARSSPPATPRRWASSAPPTRSDLRVPGRPVGRGLRRHRDRRLPGPHDRAPAALRIRSPRRGAAPRGVRVPVDDAADPSSSHPRSWSAGPRRHRRRAEPPALTRL